LTDQPLREEDSSMSDLVERVAELEQRNIAVDAYPG
jgi:hypothetical protein